MATVGDVFSICYSRAKRAQRGQDATSDELYKVLEEAMGRYFSIGQRVNLEWFTVKGTVPFSATRDGWPRPADAESVHRIEWQAGEEVSGVPFDKQDTEPHKPSVYKLRGVYHLASAGDPVALTTTGADPTSLTFFYTRRPDPVTSETQDLDELWPTGHETLLGLDLALFLTRKDTRVGDVEGLTAMREESLKWFVEFLEHEDRTTIYQGQLRRRWSYGPSVPGGRG